MRVFRLFAACSVGALASCSLITSFNGIGTGGAGGAATTTGAGGSGAMASSGGGTTSSQTGGSPSSDASTDRVDGAADAAPDGCVEGHFYCGGHVVEGHDASLYQCLSGEGVVFAAHCYDGCVEGSNNDRCDCHVPGHYCGGDDIVGDPDTLYSCDGVGPKGTVIQVCGKGCVIGAVGKDDYCAN